jgi:hypothetical protein
MQSTYATAFAAHHARGSTLSPRDTTFRRGDTMAHRPPMLRARDTMVHRPTTLRARDTTTTTRSTQSLGDFNASDRANMRVPDPALGEPGRGSRFRQMTRRSEECLLMRGGRLFVLHFGVRLQGY